MYDVYGFLENNWEQLVCLTDGQLEEIISLSIRSKPCKAKQMTVADKKKAVSRHQEFDDEICKRFRQCQEEAERKDDDPEDFKKRIDQQLEPINERILNLKVAVSDTMKNSFEALIRAEELKLEIAGSVRLKNGKRDIAALKKKAAEIINDSAKGAGDDELLKVCDRLAHFEKILSPLLMCEVWRGILRSFSTPQTDSTLRTLNKNHELIHRVSEQVLNALRDQIIDVDSVNDPKLFFGNVALLADAFKVDQLRSETVEAAFYCFILPIADFDHTQFERFVPAYLTMISRYIDRRTEKEDHRTALEHVTSTDELEHDAVEDDGSDTIDATRPSAYGERTKKPSTKKQASRVAEVTGAKPKRDSFQTAVHKQRVRDCASLFGAILPSAITDQMPYPHFTAPDRQIKISLHPWFEFFLDSRQLVIVRDAHFESHIKQFKPTVDFLELVKQGHPTRVNRIEPCTHPTAIGTDETMQDSDRLIETVQAYNDRCCIDWDGEQSTVNNLLLGNVTQRRKDVKASTDEGKTVEEDRDALEYYLSITAKVSGADHWEEVTPLTSDEGSVEQSSMIQFLEEFLADASAKKLEDYSTLSTAELKTRCKELDLSEKGKKLDLLARLKKVGAEFSQAILTEVCKLLHQQMAVVHYHDGSIIPLQNSPLGADTCVTALGGKFELLAVPLHEATLEHCADLHNDCFGGPGGIDLDAACVLLLSGQSKFVVSTEDHGSLPPVHRTIAVAGETVLLRGEEMRQITILAPNMTLLIAHFLSVRSLRRRWPGVVHRKLTAVLHVLEKECKDDETMQTFEQKLGTSVKTVLESAMAQSPLHILCHILSALAAALPKLVFDENDVLSTEEENSKYAKYFRDWNLPFTTQHRDMVLVKVLHLLNLVHRVSDWIRDHRSNEATKLDVHVCDHHNEVQWEYPEIKWNFGVSNHITQDTYARR